MDKAYQRVEFAANILIIIVALLLGVVLVQKFISTVPANTIDRKIKTAPEIGMKINLPGVSWSPQSKTLILVLQTGCRFCNDSIPFYKQVIESMKDKNVKLVAVFPTGENGTAYLNNLGIVDIDVKHLPLADLQVRGTPTLILTNGSGEITKFWVGKLPPDKEAEVIDNLNEGTL